MCLYYFTPDDRVFSMLNFSSPMRYILREPLLHFLAIAALLFACDALLSGDRKERIFIDQQTVQYIIKMQEDIGLRSLSPAERQEVIDTYVGEEILYAEAYKRGLDRGDTRMRRNMIYKMRGLLTADIGDPTEEQLRTYFEAHRSDYIFPPTWTLKHVFFPDTAQVPENLAIKLNNGMDPSTLGDIRPGLGRTIPDRSRRDLARTFGPEAAKAILAITDDQWHGPIRSVRGVHFIRIAGRKGERSSDFEQMKDYLKGDWIMAMSRKAVQEELGRLKDKYEVIVEDGMGQEEKGK